MFKNIVNSKISFGVIVGTRGFFNPVLAEKGRELLTSRLKELGYEVVIPPKEITGAGAVETEADARKYAEFFNKNINKIDGFIVSLPNFSDELGIVNTLQGVHKKLPVLVHAFDDDIEKLGLDENLIFCRYLESTLH